MQELVEGVEGGLGVAAASADAEAVGWDVGEAGVVDVGQEQEHSGGLDLAIGLGLGFSFVPIMIAALAGVQRPQAGLASGLINTSQQIGGALGVAALSTLAASQTARRLRPGRRSRPP